uniref:Galectin n=1 Tax=Globodera rostochiensis TaxID=31243 RepID=A0A914H0H6_GLORO
MLSTFEELSSIPPGTIMASCCGQLIKIMDSGKKLSIILACASGEQIILKLSALKAQRFNPKFDGKTFFQTPFEFELIFTKNSKVQLLESEIKEAENFVAVAPGHFYKVKCVLTAPFSVFGETFVAAVGDNYGKRADIFVKGEQLAEKLGNLKRNDQLQLTKCFGKIEGIL